MRSTWYLVIGCDGCGLTQKVDSWSSDQVPAWKQPAPEGWLDSADPMAWRITDPFGSQISEICPTCLALPFAQLIEQIRHHSEEMASGKSD